MFHMMRVKRKEVEILQIALTMVLSGWAPKLEA